MNLITYPMKDGGKLLPDPFFTCLPIQGKRWGPVRQRVLVRWVGGR